MTHQPTATDSSSAKRIVVVLGMHRSGTSALTRGLTALGVGLGERLMPPAPDNNETGFWEDVDVQTLNDELLAHVGLRWDALGPISPAALTGSDIGSFRARALAALQGKLRLTTVFGLKDPRASRLLPFWTRVFQDAGCEPSFILCLRHPLSVQASLVRRDGMDPVKTHFLWLDHVSAAISGSTGHPRLVVDYDLLMRSPKEELGRIAKTLGLPFDPSSAPVAEYAGQFLARRLQHTLYDAEALQRAEGVPGMAAEVYGLCLRVARDELSLDDPVFQEGIARAEAHLRSLALPFGCINRADTDCRQLRSIDEQRAHVLRALEERREHLEQVVVARDRLVASLNAVVADREMQLSAVEATLAGERNRITQLEQSLGQAQAASRGLAALLALPEHRLVDAIGAWVARHPFIKRVIRTLIGPRVDPQAGNHSPELARLQAERIERAARPETYLQWIERHEPPEASYPLLASAHSRWPRRPLISVLMPVFNAPEDTLRAAIASVQAQLYPHWELCVADDASTQPHVRRVLDEAASVDARIRVVYRETNGHICAASNSALAMAAGDYAALLDHDDALHPLALHFVAEALVHNPDCEIVYTDEDKLGLNGLRVDPYFKCDFNPELMLAHNMISHLGVYRVQTLRDLGGFREGFEGSQDYDVALRVLDRSGPGKVVHIPRVLYHWRMGEGSTAVSADEKPYAVTAARRAIADHLARRGWAGEVVAAPEAPGMNRVIFAVPNPAPSVTLVIPTRDRVDLLRQCVQSVLERSTYPNFKVLIVDNGSREPATLDYLRKLPAGRCQILRDESPFNFSILNNRAAHVADGEFLCLLNNDTEVVTPGWLEELVRFGARKGVGCVGARLWYPDGTLQHGGVILGMLTLAGHAHRHLRRGEPGYFGRGVLHQRVSAVTAACLLVRRSIYLEVGGLDETLQVAFNDIDFCLRVREAGYANIWTPYAELIHHESATRGLETTPEKRARFEGEVRQMQQRWRDQLVSDPAYSPNLSLEHEDFRLRW